MALGGWEWDVPAGLREAAWGSSQRRPCLLLCINLPLTIQFGSWSPAYPSQKTTLGGEGNEGERASRDLTPQIKVPKGISLRAVFAGRDSSIHVLQDCKHPTSQGSQVPLSKSRHCVRTEGGSHHCWHSPSLLSDPVKLNQCHTKLLSSGCAAHTGLCSSAL